MKTLLRSAAFAAITVAFNPVTLRAQGNLSSWGLGYPQGQLSTRAEGTGGAVAEIDPISLANPAALAFIGTTTLFFQIEPEYRRVTIGGASDKTTTARYPLFAAVVPLGSRWAVGVTSATLLDRTWTTNVDSNVVFGTDTVASTFVYGSSGSINDLRVALAWTPKDWVRLGVGGHLMSGSDRVFVGRTFTNNAAFGNFADSSTLGFDGGAVSGGIELVAPKLAIASASFRKGGNLNARRNDTTLASGHVPDHAGFSLAYVGVEGTEIAARTSFDKWSQLNGLGHGNSTAVDAWDTSIGADIAGPRLGSRPLQLRLGGRWRTLPFTVGTAQDKVRETSLSGGLGTTFGGGRVLTDITVIRSRRDAGIAVDERAWTLSVGLAIRP